MSTDVARKLFVSVFLLLVVTFLFKSSEQRPDCFTARLRGALSSDEPQLVHYVKFNYLLPPSTLEYNLVHDIQHSMDLKFGLHGNLNLIKKLFQNHRNGFFLEAGALDGQYLSNTLWLEQNMGWTGLLIEPESRNFHDLQLKHRKAWISNSCISSSEYPKVITLVTPKDKLAKTALNYRGAAFEYGIEYKDKLIINYVNRVDHLYESCQCFPLYTYLLALNVSTVDFLSLDVQGTEMDIMSHFPFDKIRVRALVIEDMEMKTRTDIIAWFNRKNFTFIDHLPYDYFFVHKEEKTLLENVSKA